MNGLTRGWTWQSMGQPINRGCEPQQWGGDEPRQREKETIDLETSTAMHVWCQLYFNTSSMEESHSLDLAPSQARWFGRGFFNIDLLSRSSRFGSIFIPTEFPHQGTYKKSVISNTNEHSANGINLGYIHHRGN